jgi:hypothetical protein
MRLKISDRLNAVWHVLRGDDVGLINGGHRYGIVIGDSCYMADSYTIDPYSGDPEWDYSGQDGKIHCKKYDGWILKEFR